MEPADPSLRVCHIVESGETGVLAMVLLAAETQRAKGHHVLVLFCKRPGTPADLRAKTHPDIELVELKMRPFIPYLPIWLLGCARVFRRTCPDILILYSSFAGFFGRLVAARRFKGKVLYFPLLAPFIRNDFSPFRRTLFGALDRLAQAICPAVYIASSRSEQAAIAAQRIGEPVRVLENAIDDRMRLFRRSRQARPRPRWIVTCARIAPQKDPQLFARICQLARSARPELEFEWIGDGDPEARRVLRTAGVRVTGFLAREEALARVAKACVYLSTSISESQPIGVLEAMILGIPVLCRQADWSEDAVADGETGFLFVDARSAATILLSVDANSLTSASESAYRMASRRFSQDHFATELERICQELAPRPTSLPRNQTESGTAAQKRQPKKNSSGMK